VTSQGGLTLTTVGAPDFDRVVSRGREHVQLPANQVQSTVAAQANITQPFVRFQDLVIEEQLDGRTGIETGRHEFFHMLHSVLAAYSDLFKASS